MQSSEVTMFEKINVIISINTFRLLSFQFDTLTVTPKKARISIYFGFLVASWYLLQSDASPPKKTFLFVLLNAPCAHHHFFTGCPSRLYPQNLPNKIIYLPAKPQETLQGSHKFLKVLQILEITAKKDHNITFTQIAAAITFFPNNFIY